MTADPRQPDPLFEAESALMLRASVVANALADSTEEVVHRLRPVSEATDMVSSLSTGLAAAAATALASLAVLRSGTQTFMTTVAYARRAVDERDDLTRQLQCTLDDSEHQIGRRPAIDDAQAATARVRVGLNAYAAGIGMVDRRLRDIMDAIEAIDAGLAEVSAPRLQELRQTLAQAREFAERVPGRMAAMTAAQTDVHGKVRRLVVDLAARESVESTDPVWPEMATDMAVGIAGSTTALAEAAADLARDAGDLSSLATISDRLSNYRPPLLVTDDLTDMVRSLIPWVDEYDSQGQAVRYLITALERATAEVPLLVTSLGPVLRALEEHVGDRRSTEALADRHQQLGRDAAELTLAMETISRSAMGSEEPAQVLRRASAKTRPALSAVIDAAQQLSGTTRELTAVIHQRQQSHRDAPGLG